MIKYIFIFAIAVLMAPQVIAQDLSDYKYIIVPAQFNFQKEPGQYKVNDLTKFLFQKYGFDAYLSSEQLPQDLNVNGCNTLYMAVDSGGFLGTHLNYTLADCRGQVVYTSPEGNSKIKEYEGAYNEVMREAMTGLEDIGYTYSDEVLPTENTVAIMGSAQNNDERTDRKQKTPEKVVVRAVPNKQITQNEPEQVPQEEKSLGGNEVEKVVSATQTNIPNEDHASAKAYTTYKSVDGSYALKRTTTGFDVYEGDSKIGVAKATSSGSYLVTTSQFMGVGSMQGDVFTVEREIKGVQGLVKMQFKGTDQ